MNKTIKWRKIYKEAPALFKIMATNQEVADFFNISLSSVKRDKKLQAMKKSQESIGKLGLKSSMFKKAINDKDFNAQKWLSQNYLGMSDKQEIIHDSKNEDGMITINVLEPKKKKPKKTNKKK